MARSDGLPPEDMRLTRLVADAAWDLKGDVEDLETRSRITSAQRSALLSIKRDLERMRQKLERARPTRRKPSAAGGESEPESTDDDDSAAAEQPPLGLEN